jgi:hypothetical protein
VPRQEAFFLRNANSSDAAGIWDANTKQTRQSSVVSDL